MEQEPERPILSDTVKRVGSALRLAIHLTFIVLAFFLAIVVLARLVAANV